VDVIEPDQVPNGTLRLNVVLRKDPQMLARLQKAQEEHEEGFTLIELLVVIIIIGILAAIAIPVFLSQRQKGYDAGIKSDLRNAATAEESYLTDNDQYFVGTSTPAATDPLVLEGLKFSSTGDYTSTGQQIVAILVNKSGTTTAPVGNNEGYCLSAVSASGHKFAYNSATGGLKSGTSATCP
jgi:type IV pilus assembly protein PilA